MHYRAGMWHHVGSTMKIVRNTLFVVGGKGGPTNEARAKAKLALTMPCKEEEAKRQKGRLRTILLVTAIAATQEGSSPSQHHATFAW